MTGSLTALPFYEARRPLRVMLLVVCLAGCGDSGGGAGVGTPIAPTEGLVGPAGGRVESDGAALDVPAGALAGDVTIRLASTPGPVAPTGVTVVGPAIEIGPAGTIFATPATVTLPYDPATLPATRTEADIRIHTAANVDGSYTPLVTTLDTARRAASAPVDHLSVFVAGVPSELEPPGTGDPAPCVRDSTCGCEAIRAARPLDVTGQVDLQRRIRFMCYDAASGELTVLSFTVLDGAFPTPDQYFVTTHDGETLAQLTETPTEETLLPMVGDCGPLPTRQGTIVGEEPFLAGADLEAGVDWSVSFREQDGWTEAVLHIESLAGEVDISFNRHLNEPQAVDTDPFFERSNGLAGRVLEDGSARFYLHVWRSFHVDLLQLDDLEAYLTNPTPFRDGDGRVQPSVRERFELGSGETNSTYSFNPIHLGADPADASADLALLFSGVRGIRVQRAEIGLEIDERLDYQAPPNSVYAGWQNGGLDSAGRLYAQSQFAQFSNSLILAIDPDALAVTAEWEIGCIGAPTLSGFHVYPSGRLLRFADDIDLHAVQFVRNGRLEATGEVAFGGHPLRLVTDETVGRVYVAEDLTGMITAVRHP